jgi:hypothetical protein
VAPAQPQPTPIPATNLSPSTTANSSTDAEALLRQALTGGLDPQILIGISRGADPSSLTAGYKLGSEVTDAWKELAGRGPEAQEGGDALKALAILKSLEVNGRPMFPILANPAISRIVSAMAVNSLTDPEAANSAGRLVALLIGMELDAKERR